MRETPMIFAALLAVVAAAGCGQDDQPARVAAPAATTTAPSPSPEPSPTPEPTRPPGLGDEQTSTSDSAVTVLAYEQPVAGDSPQPAEAGYPDGYVWAGLDARVCVPDTPPDDGYDTYLVNTTVWRLAFPDGSLVDTSHTGYAGFPQPEYPWGDTDVRPGQCVRGWMVFPVPGGQLPEAVQYTGGGGLLQWQMAEEE